MMPMKKLNAMACCVLLIPSSQIFAMPYTIPVPPPGICVFDIDSTLTEPGSMTAVETCVNLGYGIGINTGEDKATAQTSMDAIYNGISRRGNSLLPLYEGGYYDRVRQYYYQYHNMPNLLEVIGDGTNTVAPGSDDTPLYAGDVALDYLFQYSGGCKVNAPFQCTNYPYKHEGLESIAEFYYPDYQRSQPGNYPPAASEQINECIILFDDQKSTIESYANNMTETLGNITEFSKQFRGVHIQQPGWLIDTDTNAKATVCNTLKRLPTHCQVAAEKMQSVCGV